MKISQIYDKYYPPFCYVKTNSGKEFRVWCRSIRDWSICFRSEFKTKYKGVSKSMYYTQKKVRDIIKDYCDKEEKKLINTSLKTFFDKLQKAANRGRSKMLNWRTYDLWKEIEKHPFLKNGNPAAAALEWYRKDIVEDTSLHIKGNLLRQGFLYTFNYDTPKYESVLDFFDTQPLVISFGPTETSLGMRDIGINLHLYPPRIRRIIMYKVFEIYRKMYKDQLFAKNPKEIPVKWIDIKKPLEKYGVAFGVRMYIPSLRTNAIQFLYEHWASAIYLPSKRIAKKTQAELEKLWAEFVKDQRKKNGPAKDLNESWRKS